MPARHIEVVSGLNMYDSQPFLPTNNLLCCLSCQNVTVIFQNVHNTSLTLTAITITGSYFPTTVIAINGNPPSFPISIASGATFSVTFQICVDVNNQIEDYWKFFFTTVQHDDEEFYYVPMTCVTFANLLDTLDVDFGNVPVGLPQSQFVTITNTTIADIDYDITLCPPLIGTNLSGNLPRINGQQTIEITWTPSAFPESLSCTAEAYESNSEGNCNANIDIYGQSSAVDCDPEEGGICCLNVTLNTENAYINPQSELCLPEETYNSAAILEKKQLVYELKYLTEITTGTTFLFNTYLFASNPNVFDNYLAPNNPPSACYSYTVSPSTIAGNPYAMTLINTGANTNNQKNIQAYLTIIDAENGTFRVTFDFYVVCDKNSMINNTVFSNRNKYQKSTLNDSLLYNNTIPSVYTQNEYITSYFMIQKANSRNTFVHSIPFTARFYDRGLYNNPSEFTNPTWTLSRNNNIVNTLSSFEPTKVTFTITVPPNYGGCSYILFHVVNESLNTNTSLFIPATDASRAEITYNPNPGILDNHLLSPSTFTNLGGNVYEATCYFDTELNISDGFRFFAIVYGANNYTVNTFKSIPYRVRAVPDYDCGCEPKIESYWDNYFESRETDDYRPVGKERIKHRLVLKDGAFGNCLEDWGLEVADWRELLSKVNLRIYKRQLNFPADPNQNYTTFFEYGNYTSIRDNSALYGWQNFGVMKVSDESINEIHIETNNIRVPWENNLFTGNVSQCKMPTYMNKYPITAPTSTNYISALNVLDTWIDEDVYFEYEFVFDFSPIFAQPFVFSICRAFMVSAISFENVNSGFPPHIIDFQFEGYDPTINTWIPLPSLVNVLNYSQLRLIYTSDDVAPYIGWFNFFIETAPFGLPNLIESNATASPNGLQNYGLADIVTNQSVQYSVVPVAPYEAHVYIDTAELRNTSYRFCGYWTERTLTPTCTYLNRHDRIETQTQYIQMNTPQLSDDLAIIFLNVPQNRFLYARSRNLASSLPVVGGTYYFHYNFASPTTRVIEIWFSQNGFSGSPTITIPVGETIGVIMFTMPIGPLTPDFWTMRFGAGTDYSGAAVFKIGNEYCE